MQRIRLRQAVNMPICQLVKTRNTSTNPGPRRRKRVCGGPAFRNITGRQVGPLLRLRPIIIRAAQETIPRAERRVGPDGRKHHGMIRRVDSVRTADAYTYVQHQQNIR